MTREEAIKELRGFLGQLTEGCQEAIKVLIPELKEESEDERIRKKIVSAMSYYRNDGCISEYEFGVCRNWLEKQKEQKPAGWSPTKEQMVALNWAANGMLDNDSPSTGDIKASLRSLYNDLQSKSIRSAEWSEEDEYLMNETIQHLEQLIRIDKAKHCGVDVQYYQRDIDWLKSLRPQPKAELTPLDKNIINAAVAFVEQNDHFNCWGGIDKHTVIKALRSLKPHWKPSEEQMNSLRDTIVNTKGYQYSVYLPELYEQLKKLM